MVPTRVLAEAIAAEWSEVPDKGDINVSHLPLTRLAATGLDRVTTQRARVIDDTAKYASSDMLCYRAGEPESLVKRQRETWQPLLEGIRHDIEAGARFLALLEQQRLRG